MENGWERYQQKVLTDLKELKGDFRIIRTELTELRVQTEALKIKAGFWGAIAGGIPALVAVLAILWHHFSK